jgi:cell division protein FtsQ
MSQTSSNPPSTRTWRDIPQPVTPRIRTLGPEGKKRLAMAVGNIVGLILVLGAAGWGVFEVAALWEKNPARITAPTKGVPVRDYALRTDGVLDKGWVQRTLALPKEASLMELDLADLKRRLEESGQVSKAVIERRFPDVLVITLQERSPVARVMALIGDAAPVVFMVARDGMVYSGSGYDTGMTESLPFIDGVKLLRNGSGFERLEGMDVVADLLGTAQVTVPEIYQSFKVVNLARFGLDRTISVKSSEIDTIVFDSSQNGFFRQLAKLFSVLEETHRMNPPPRLKRVNLAIDDKQVPVLFDNAAEARETSRAPAVSTLRAAPSTGATLFPPSFRNSSPTQRDF